MKFMQECVQNRILHPHVHCAESGSQISIWQSVFGRGRIGGTCGVVQGRALVRFVPQAAFVTLGDWARAARRRASSALPGDLAPAGPAHARSVRTGGASPRRSDPGQRTGMAPIGPCVRRREPRVPTRAGNPPMPMRGPVSVRRQGACLARYFEGLPASGGLRAGKTCAGPGLTAMSIDFQTISPVASAW